MLIALVFLVAALWVFFDLIQPTYGQLQTKKGTELSSENFLSNEQQIVGQAKTLINQYENESAVQDSLALAMPSGPNTASALAQVYGIALNNNIAVQSVSVAAPTSRQSQNQAQGTSTASTTGQGPKQMETFSFQVTAFGSYENFKSFLSQLETNIRIFDLTALSVQEPTSSDATNGKGSSTPSDFFTYGFTVATYYELP